MSGLVVADLDGTLLGPGRTYDERDLAALRALGARGVVRCIATGRSPYSARQVIPREMPIDYLIFSSGAGIVEWSGDTMLACRLMTSFQVERAFAALAARGLDFMVHDSVPENHRFDWFSRDGGGEDFRRRIARYDEFARPGDWARFHPRISTQLLGVAPAGAAGEREYLGVRADLEGLSVVRSTSPLDGASTWIEVFSPEVSKSQAAATVAARHGIPRERTLALGNDYNDEDLLAWSGLGLVVADAPARLRARFGQVVAGGGGLAEAVAAWGLAGGG